MTARSYLSPQPAHSTLRVPQNSYIPIARQDYKWLLSSGSCCSGGSNRDPAQWQLTTPHKAPSLCESFNSSSFSQSRFQTPLVLSPNYKTVVSKNKPKRLMKKSYIQENQCSICLEVVRNQATLPCGHKYCFDCLQEWFKNATKCPYCRKQVEYFRCGGQEYVVESKEFEYVPQNDEVMDWLCYRCDHTEEGDIVLICDRCGAYACHIECDQTLNGVQPEGDWFCHYCR